MKTLDPRKRQTLEFALRTFFSEDCVNSSGFYYIESIQASSGCLSLQLLLLSGVQSVTDPCPLYFQNLSAVWSHFFLSMSTSLIEIISHWYWPIKAAASLVFQQ